MPGSGSEVFARQIAYTRAKQNAVTYLTVKKTPEFLKDDMTTNGWDVTPLENSGKWRFLKLKRNISLSGIVSNEIKQHRSIVVDSLSELLLTRKTESVVNLLTAMMHENRERQEYHLVLLTQGMQDEKIETTMEHFAEGVITFNTKWNADSTSRNLVIKKMRGMLVPTRRLPYAIGKKGFIIETATRIT